jgi:hypothetical protein
MWNRLVGPGALFIILEKLLRLRNRMTGKGRTFINYAILLPSSVTHIVCRKPPNFNFHAGDYVYLNIPAIASYEWHPFTISSAPELPGKYNYCLERLRYYIKRRGDNYDFSWDVLFCYQNMYYRYGSTFGVLADGRINFTNISNESKLNNANFSIIHFDQLHFS